MKIMQLKVYWCPISIQFQQWPSGINYFKGLYRLGDCRNLLSLANQRKQIILCVCKVTEGFKEVVSK